MPRSLLADKMFESFFRSCCQAPAPTIDQRLLGGFWSTVAIDNNERILNMLTGEIGKTNGKPQVVHCPSIGCDAVPPIIPRPIVVRSSSSMIAALLSLTVTHRPRKGVDQDWNTLLQRLWHYTVAYAQKPDIRLDTICHFG
ncbi:hypothetical protein BDP27DRAFT_1342339 [Rhodocollybia butyracea]|uniref:Uncharacterized protein n=1 Tax=Rhodocollybia butyracea TaxID=206335 RepID=A0A9P5PA26_9AGAR|nr:hypothetical protein BDP27DRAFT_1342339 [Rhodocollybia butyracea]